MASKRAPKGQANRDVVRADLQGRGLRAKSGSGSSDLGPLFTSPSKSDTSELKKQRCIRIEDSVWQVIQAHFGHQGISAADGIRMIITRYLDEHVIHPRQG